MRAKHEVNLTLCGNKILIVFNIKKSLYNSGVLIWNRIRISSEEDSATVRSKLVWKYHPHLMYSFLSLHLDKICRKNWQIKVVTIPLCFSLRSQGIYMLKDQDIQLENYLIYFPKKSVWDIPSSGPFFQEKYLLMKSFKTYTCIF